MKKNIALALTIFLTLTPLIGQAEGYVSIAEMNQQDISRWTQTYETKWRSVDIDVQPRLPKVEAFPILKVSPNLDLPDVSSLGNGWESSLRIDALVNTFLNGGVSEFDRIYLEQKVNLSQSMFYAPYDMERVYVENSELTLREVLEASKDMLITIGDDPENWDLEKPEMVVCQNLTDKSGEYLYPAEYFIIMNQRLSGIPLYHRGYSREEEGSWRTRLLLYICKPEALELGWFKVTPTEVLASDIPLCDFSAIKTALESEIEGGHIRKIFDMDLGYVLYNEPGVEYGVPRDQSKLPEAIYYSYPVWQINCHYVESGSKELSDYSTLDMDERAVMDYYSILFDAQTGEKIDIFNTRKDDGDFMGFISWEDVGGAN